MPRFYAKFRLSMFTEHEATVDSSTVADKLVCECAESAAHQYAARYQWRDGAGDLIAWAWEELNRLRNKGTPVRAWSRALAYDFVDLLRRITKARRIEAVPVFCNLVSKEYDGYSVNASFGDDGIQFFDTVEARRAGPESAEQLLAEFDHELNSLSRVDREIIRGLARGLLMREVAETLSISESGVSQRVQQICAKFGGEYIGARCRPDSGGAWYDSPARRASLQRMQSANRERAAERRAKQCENISENPAASG